MIETGLEVLDAVISNPLEALLLFATGYVIYRMRNARSRKRFHYEFREQQDLWSFKLFPARYRYEFPELYLKKDLDEND